MKPDYEKQRSEAYELYLQGLKYQEIADAVGVTLSAVKSWATRYWKKEKLQPKKKPKKVATKKTKRKGGAPFGNKNATGPPRNQNARKHGLFSKWLPEEVKEIVGELESIEPLDILWQNIQLQYAAILRAQKIMWVKDREDTTSIINFDSDKGTGYLVQTALDKQETFMKAQTRAMSELRSMIKQYDEMLNKNWELASEEQKARINQLKAQTDKLQNKETETEEFEDDGFLDALKGTAKDDWNEEEAEESEV